MRVEVLHRGLDFPAETEDVGPKGCLVASPRPLDPGAWVRLLLVSDRLSQRLRVTGRVAWAVQPERQRAGVAFAEMKVERDQDPSVWFDRLMRATPGLAPLMRHVPNRLPFDTPLYLRPPPRYILDFSNEELGLVAGMRNGVTVEQTLHRLEPQRKNPGRLVFALLARRVLSLSAREASDPSAWRPLLRRAGFHSRAGDEPEEVVRLADLAVDPGPAAAPPGGDREILPPSLAQPSPAWAGASTLGSIVPPLIRQAPVTRSPQAEHHYQHALAVAAGGDLSGAIRLLRQALELSPRDLEIAKALDRLELGDRTVAEQ